MDLEEASVFVVKLHRIIKTLISYAGDIKAWVKDLGPVVQIIRSILEEIDNLQNDSDVIQLKQKVLQCKTLLLKAYNSACSFMNTMEKCFEYGNLTNDLKITIIEGVKKKNFDKLNSYLEQINRYFSQCDTFHVDFKKLIKNAISMSGECNTLSSYKRFQAAGGKNMSKWGRVARGVGIVVGMSGVAGAAAMAGFFSFGFGTPVLLAIGTAASGGATATGAAATLVGGKISTAGDHYQKLEKGFKEIASKFEEMLDTASNLDVDINKINEVLKGMKNNEFNISENVKKKPSECVDIDTLLRCFEILIESIKKERKSIEEIKKKMEDYGKYLNGD